MMSPGRCAGLMLPLFSLRSQADWGIGEIDDLGRLARWLEGAGQRVVQLLPINELPAHETSPYSALSGMAIDPAFISLPGYQELLSGRPAASCTSNHCPAVSQPTLLDDARAGGFLEDDDVPLPIEEEAVRVAVLVRPVIQKLPAARSGPLACHRRRHRSSRSLAASLVRSQ